MKKYKSIIITCLLIAALILIYWWGGNGVGLRGWTVEKPQPTQQSLTAEEKVALAKEKAKAELVVTDDTDKPEPIQPDEQIITDEEYTCTLSVRCDTILNNMDFLVPDKAGIVPANGVIFAERTVTFNEGETVFDVLLREMQSNKIHMEYTSVPMYNSVYIEGISNLYEFDCGELSGWMYRVNGWFPNYGCSRYTLKKGDKIEWLYTCD